MKMVSGHSSIYGHHNSKDQDIVPLQDQCTIENLILEVPEDLTPDEEKENEASALSLSPYPEGS